jgi:NADH-quinone oxidoreductase subunit L
MIAAAALAPIFALLGALVNGLLGRRLKEPLPGWIASLAVGAAFTVTLGAFFTLLGNPEAEGVTLTLWNYLNVGALNLSIGVTVDTLSVTMMMIITGVGLLIHIYSIAYMHGDEGFSRYFAYLNLFIAAMLVLVLADSFLLMFVGWEGVGVCSYLLIGFWYQDKANANAARKAFIVNRVGDVGFLLAMFTTFMVFGSLHIPEVNALALEGAITSPLIAIIGIFFLIAAAGKSAQLPLHVWLPDAMAGPTPVSALIHAATMVTAGVYLVARAAPIFALSPLASLLIACVGVLTALIAAFTACSQTDIKKILAYSTISQLGFMFAAVGAGAYWVGIFHVLTHSFFKALLFLAAGSVIHALGGEQDIRKMGGLGKHMKITGTTALLAVLAISGMPFMAGFFSKDAILAGVLNTQLFGFAPSFFLFSTLLFTGVLTAFYMFRWYYVVFAGPERLSEAAKAHLHESPALMTVPLIILAILSVTGGYIGLPEFAFFNWIEHFLERSIHTEVPFHHPPVAVEWFFVIVSEAAALLGLLAGYWVYHLRKGRPVESVEGPVADLSRSGLGFDASYQRVFVEPATQTAGALAVLDKTLIDDGLTQAAGRVGWLAGVVRGLQSGYARLYALAMFIGLALLSLAVALLGGLA